MKILARVSESRLIVEIGTHEIANILGYNYESEIKARGALNVGNEINVSVLFKALNASRDRKDELARMANGLRDAAKKIDSINAALEEPILVVEK